VGYHATEIVETFHILGFFLSIILRTADGSLEILITLVLSKENITTFNK